MPVTPLLETWIGTEVLDSSGDKLGKLEDVYFRGDEPIAVSIRSGLGGRKHHAAVLRGSVLSREQLSLDSTSDELISIGGDGLGAEHMALLAGQDEGLRGLSTGDIESWTVRDERHQAQVKAQADADSAAVKERDAELEAEQARREREDADAQLLQTRDDAGRPG